MLNSFPRKRRLSSREKSRNLSTLDHMSVRPGSTCRQGCGYAKELEVCMKRELAITYAQYRRDECTLLVRPSIPWGMSVTSLDGSSFSHG